MESKANYALIGTFVLIAMLAAVAFITWISSAQFDQEYDEYEVVFVGPVRGLSRGSEVRYNGLNVGEVVGLRWDDDDNNTVIARVRVVDNTPVYIDSEAQLEPQGLTGLNYIQVTAGVSGELFTGRQPYQITGKMSQLDTFLDGGESIISGAQGALQRVNTVMTAEAIGDFHAILANTRELTYNLRDTDIDSELVERVLISFEKAAKDVSDAAIAVDEAAVDFETLVQDDVSPLIPRIRKSLDNVDVMLASFTDFAEGGEHLTTDARDAINRLSNSGLTDLEETADGLRRLILSLNELADQLDRSPIAFIAGEESEVMELPQ